MADTPIVITEHDVSDKTLLLRALRKTSDAVTNLRNRLGKLEAAPLPPTMSQVRAALQATGSNPLNITGLAGVAQQPQLAGAPRLATAPSGLLLQQYKDTQLLLVGTTSTGFALNAVVAGNPNSLYQLLGGLSTSSVIGSTSTNLMTLDTVQTSTGNKTLQGTWTFNASPVIDSTTSSPTLLLDTSGTLRGTIGVAGGANALITGASSGDVVIKAEGKNIDLSADSGTTLMAQMTTAGNWKLSGKVTQYHSLATTGEGVPYILARDAQITKTSSIANTVLYTATSTGEYRISYYLECNTTGTATPAFTYGYTNDVTGRTVTLTSLALTVAGIDQQGSFFIHSNTTQIFYNVATTSTVAPVGSYSIYVILERLS